MLNWGRDDNPATRRAPVEQMAVQVQEWHIGEGEVDVATVVDGLLVVLFSQEPAGLPQPPGEDCRA